MEEPLLIPEPLPEVPPPPAMPLAARLLNVFAIPGAVFADVRACRGSAANWIVPALLLGLAGMLTAMAVLSQPDFQQQMNKRFAEQAQALEQQVKAGKIKPAEAERLRAFTRTFARPEVLRSLGGTMAFGFGVVRVFWWALVLWLLGRAFLKIHVNYLKALEVAGLALMISVLGSVVSLLLMVNLPRLFSTQDWSQAVSDFNPSHKNYLLLGTANIFALWLVCVLSVGLARLADVPFRRAMWFVFAAWLIQQLCLVTLQGVTGQFML